jgi:hypothetical protein
VGYAAMLYGDLRNADRIKIHVTSGKASLMRFDDFEGKPLPRMVERVKVKLRERQIDFSITAASAKRPIFTASREL